MITIKHQGRTGNLLLQNIGVSIIAKKFDMCVQNYSTLQDIEALGLSLFSGNVINQQMKNYYDGDLFELLQSEKVDNGIIFDGLFQLKKFVTEYKSEILSHFDLKYEDKKNQVFVHIRLGDVVHTNPGLKYYQTALNQLKFDSGYISTDTPNHPIVQTLMRDYNLEFYNDSPVKTIEFAKNFDNLILSKGTFSWWIGLLSKASNIYYPINDVGWHGDIFVYDSWTPIDINNL
jgi:hypothetical protein